jgi:glycosyltransferase involved in cell wall biosynthesis
VTNGHWKQLIHDLGGKAVIARDIPATFPVGGEYPTNRNFNIAFINTFSEGSQTVIIEAMACGIPVVASEVGGVGELVTPETGILVNPGNPKLQCEVLLQAKA